MKMQILKLIIWPKTDKFPPREVEFKPGSLNVITGISRTGKSAIIPIIDYCLASSDCLIPIDTIRTFSSWYGVLLQLDHEQMLICRPAPVGNQIENNFFLLRRKNIQIPVKIDEPNENIDGVKNILDTISHVPFFTLNGDAGPVGYLGRLGFRDLMAFVFQNQDIVANQNILFYKTHAHEHRERLRNWFPYILGAETIEILQARNRLQDIERRLFQLKREYEKAKNHSSVWMASMASHINIAREYGLIDSRDNVINSTHDMVNVAKAVLENIPDYTKSNTKDIQGASKIIELMEIDEARISLLISQVKKRISDLERLKSGFLEYGNSIQKRADRLQISNWMMDISASGQSCPACGSSGHPRNKVEIGKISEAFKKVEGESKQMMDIPTSFAREETRLRIDLNNLLEEKKAWQKSFDLEISKDKKVREEFQKRKNMYLFLGQFKAALETFESLGDGGEFKKEIEKLESEVINLRKIIDPEGVKRKVDNAIASISQGILERLQTLDVDDKYKRVPPRFDIKNLSISILSDDNHWHFLAEVGSASNWVSFHIALMCALQEFFTASSHSSVPSFLIIDQPSQVYFPKVKRGQSETDETRKYLDVDVDAVKSIFATLVKSVEKSGGEWQCIVLDHADKSVYGEIEGVFEVEEWRGEKKLIPEIWYEN